MTDELYLINEIIIKQLYVGNYRTTDGYSFQESHNFCLTPTDAIFNDHWNTILTFTQNGIKKWFNPKWCYKFAFIQNPSLTGT